MNRDTIEFVKHNLFIYDSPADLRSFYSRMCRQFLQKNEIVVILLHDETASFIEQHLEDEGIDVKFYKRGGMLFIFDAAKQFFGSEYGLAQFLSLLGENALKAGKKGVCVLTDVNAFCACDSARLGEYERLMDWSDYDRVTLVCMYEKEQVGKMGEKEIDLLLTQHRRFAR